MDWNKEIQELKTNFTPYMKSGIYIHDGIKLLFSENKEELFP